MPIMERYIVFPSFICFPPKSQMLILNLIDRFSYSPFNPNVNLGNVQRKCVRFCKVPSEIAVSPVLIQSWPSCFTTQKLFGSLSFKELREEMECLGNVGRASQSSFPFASRPGWNLETTRTQWWLGANALPSVWGWLAPKVHSVSAAVPWQGGIVRLSAGWEAYFYLVPG